MVVGTLKKDLKMLEVQRSRWKGDDGQIRGASWDHSPAGNELIEGPPGGPVVRILHFQFAGYRFYSWLDN